MAAPGAGKALPAEEHLERLKEVVAKHRDDLRKLEQANYSHLRRLREMSLLFYS